MAEDFHSQPILNSPYAYPARHWELDDDGQPTQRITETRRPAKHITPIPKATKRKKSDQPQLVFDEGKGLSTERQAYDPTSLINEIRHEVGTWRQLPRSAWGVTAETARLLEHGRHYDFNGVRPFFCQIEAVETAIWLTEIASTSGHRSGARILRPRQRQCRGQSRAVPRRPEARHRRRQDDSHGDDHRLADGQCGACTRQQEVHEGLPRGDTQAHDPGPAARTAAQRSG